jgi:SsrA-binding protein
VSSKSGGAKRSHKDAGKRVVADNRRARYDYEIVEVVEAGLQLFGSEVKSLREGKASLGESYAGQEDSELYLLNAHIPEYPQSGRFNHEPKRRRKLLLHRKEIDKLAGKTREKGLTLVPTKIYVKDGRVKCEIAVGKGKKFYDKRETLRKRQAEDEAKSAIRERARGPE